MLPEVTQLLEAWQRSGISLIPRVALPERPREPVADTVASPRSAAVSPSLAATTGDAAQAAPVPAFPNDQSMAKKAASPLTLLASRCETFQPLDLPRGDRETRLAALKARVAQCTRCPELARTRTQTVFGVGNPEARIVFIGEAPGADEDAQGEPFVGRAGKLLNDIIGACRLKREDIYICNILRCRPPGNRLPAFDEAENCRDYLDGQLAIVNPEYVVCWGSCAAKNLLGKEDPIGKMRGQFYRYGRAKVLCTYHPSYLLRNPAAKKDVWADMKFLFQDMGIDLSTKSP